MAVTETYFSKPSVEDIVERAYAMVSEDDPSVLPRSALTVERIELSLRKPYIDLLQLLKATGLCATGGEAKWAVDEGQGDRERRT